MKMTINKSYFRDMFDEYFDNNPSHTRFSPQGIDALFEYIENYETDTQTEIEFNPYDLYSEFTEYTENELINKYGDLDVLESKTTVIKVMSTDRYLINTIF